MRGHGLSAFRVRLRARDEVVESAVCRTASEISAACSAVNNHLSDKPLDLWGSLRKGCRAKSGYKINGGTGWRHDVCLHAASKSSEMTHMNEHLSTYTVLLNQYCDFFFFFIPTLWSFLQEETVIVIFICAGYGSKTLFVRFSEAPMWVCAHLQAFIPVVFSQCHLTFFHISEESLRKPSSFYFSLCNTPTSLLSSLKGSCK